MKTAHYLFWLTVLTFVSDFITCQPIVETNNENKLTHENEMKISKPKGEIVRKRYKHRENKKDMFVSRGWGAGGMPFNVLYMNPVYSSKAPIYDMPISLALTGIEPEDHNTHHPQTRMNRPRHKVSGSKPRFVIPQLFVSYGWGPQGKK